jgi:CBS domain containing-hemolysin-like protein
MVRLDTLGTVIGIELESQDVDSVSGLILSELGRPPQAGDRIHWSGLSFEVSSLHGRGVREAIVGPDDREGGESTLPPAVE